MGTCDSSNVNRLKSTFQPDEIEEYDKPTSSKSSNFLPKLSLNSSKNDDSIHLLKKNNSTDKNSPIDKKQFLLSEKIAKRENIHKNYKFSKTVLGDGATSQVYLAKNKEGKRFSIKKIPKIKILKKPDIAIKEADICLKLDHKNIIKYYEIYEDLNFIYIVMEQGGTDLFELIINSPSGIIEEELAINILIQIFEAIDYLHNVVNIVHCDIKPENFVLLYNEETNDLSVKLVDFGNYRKKPINKERLYNFSGTKEYMAPEVFEQCGFNEKVDEWGAGVIMYNMLTGCDPFSSESDSVYRDNIRFKDIKFNYIKNEELRELNKKLLNRFMAKRITAKEALIELNRIKDNININEQFNIKEKIIKSNIWNNRAKQIVNMA